MPSNRRSWQYRRGAASGSRRRDLPLALLVIGLSVGLFGFDTSRPRIPLEEIVHGGPPKDGIPAILEPRFVAAASAKFLRPGDRIVGVVRGGVAKAYPIRILNWHEVVNDAVGRTPVAVTYCPLTASAIVFKRQVAGETLSFGVSGLLYQSNVLFYDHQSEGLWSQLKGEAVTGGRAGTELKAVPSVVTTWEDWHAKHPDTLVLSIGTGYRRDYEHDPYAPYRSSPQVMFPVRNVDTRLPPKELVFGLTAGGASRAYPLARLADVASVDDRLGGLRVRVMYDAGAGSTSAIAVDSGAPLAGIEAYWFAWAAFHPETGVWEGRGGPAASPRRLPGDELSGLAEDGHGVVVVSHSAYWTGIFGLGLGGGGVVSQSDERGMLVVRGELRNASGHGLHHVELAFELLDGRGRVVRSESGYNRGGEALRPVDSPLAAEFEEDPQVRPIPPGGSDTFRMMFLRSETPAFSTYRVRVMAVTAESD